MLISLWGRVRKMRIYNAKEVSTHKKADFQTQEIDFFYLCSSTKTPMKRKNQRFTTENENGTPVYTVSMAGEEGR